MCCPRLLASRQLRDAYSFTHGWMARRKGKEHYDLTVQSPGRQLQLLRAALTHGHTNETKEELLRQRQQRRQRYQAIVTEARLGQTRHFTRTATLSLQHASSTVNMHHIGPSLLPALPSTSQHIFLTQPTTSDTPPPRTPQLAPPPQVNDTEATKPSVRQLRLEKAKQERERDEREERERKELQDRRDEAERLERERRDRQQAALEAQLRKAAEDEERMKRTAEDRKRREQEERDEEERRRIEEDERTKRIEEERRKQWEAQEEERKKAEEDERKQRSEEASRQREEEEKRKEMELDEQRQREMEQRKRTEEEDEKRRTSEEEEGGEREAKERRRKEEEQRRVEEEELQRISQEEDRMRKAEEEEAERSRVEEETRRSKEEAETAQRIEMEEEAERARQADAAAAATQQEQLRRQDEDEERERREAEAAKLDRLQQEETESSDCLQELATPPSGSPKLPLGPSITDGAPLRRASLIRTPSTHLSRSRQSSLAMPLSSAHTLLGDVQAAPEAAEPTSQPDDPMHAAPNAGVSWVTEEDRDALFDFLASEADVFTADLQLTNYELDALLATGGSRGETIRLCRLVEARHHQVETIEQLQAAMVERRGSTTARPAAHSIVASWITATDRDALFDFLASDGCALFSADVKLNNRTLDSILSPAGSTETALRLLATMDAAQLSFETASALVDAMKVAATSPTAQPTTSAQATAAVELVTAIPSTITSVTDAAVNSAAAEPTVLKAQPTNLTAGADKAANTSTRASVSRTQPSSQQTEDEDSPTASLSTAAIEIQRPVEPAPSTAERSAEDQPYTIAVPQPAMQQTPPKQVTPLLNPAVAAVRAQPQRSSSRPSSFSFVAEDINQLDSSAPLSPLPPTQTWMTDNDREQLFAYLSLPSTRLFSQPTQLTPIMLNAMLAATGSVYTCIEVLNALQKRQLMFPHVQPLLFALQREIAQLSNRPSTTASSSQPAPRPQSPHTENRASRDALFAYLSSTSCHLFNVSVKLNNFTLDRLLYAGRGLACALACCHFMDEQGLQFASLELLVDALRLCAGQREEEEAALLAVLSHPQHQRNLFGNSLTVTIDDVRRLWLSVQAGSDTMAYLLLVEEDQMSGKGRLQLSSMTELRHEIQRRHATMRLERRKEMERLYEFMHLPARRCLKPGTIVSMEECAQLASAGRADLRPDHSTQAMRLIGEIEAQHVQCESIDELLKRVVEQRKMMEAAGKQPLANGLGSRQPKAGANWITAKDRDALFDYLASEECSLFNANVKLNNKALDSLLLAGGSLQRTLEAAKALDAAKAQHKTVQLLRDAIAARTAAPVAPPVTAPDVAPVAPLKSSRTGASAADRDAVFEVLAEETDLFSKDVKLSNKALDLLIKAAGSKDSTIEKLRAFDKRQQRFESIAALVTALSSPDVVPLATASKDCDELFAWLASDDCRLFTSPVTLNTDALSAMLTAGKGLLSTLATLKRTQACKLQFSSHLPLLPILAAVASMPPPPAQSATVAAADRDAMFDYLASDACNVFSDNVKLSNKALDKLVMAGRGVEAAVSILKQINVTTRQVGSVQALADVISDEWGTNMVVWTDLVIYFASPSAAVLLATPPTAAELLSFLWEAETGSDTVPHVSVLTPPSALYTSVSDLLPLLASARVSTLLSTNDDLATLHAVLGGREGGGSTQRLTLLDTDTITLYDCWRIAKAGRVGVERSTSVSVVNELNEEGKHFASMNELVAAVAAKSAQKHAQSSVTAAVKPMRS